MLSEKSSGSDEDIIGYLENVGRDVEESVEGIEDIEVDGGEVRDTQDELALLLNVGEMETQDLLSVDDSSSGTVEMDVEGVEVDGDKDVVMGEGIEIVHANTESKISSPTIENDEIEITHTNNKRWLPPSMLNDEEIEITHTNTKRKLPPSMLENYDDIRVTENSERREKKGDYKNNAKATPVERKYDLIDDINLLYGRVICFDVETTGFAKDDGIIEIAAIEVIDGYRTGVLFQSYAKPRKYIHPKASEVHGLTVEKLEDAPPIQFVMTSFMEFIGKSPLVAHNALFDMRMLIQELELLDLEFLINSKQVFCTQRHYRKLFPHDGYKLSDIAIRYEIPLSTNLHSALVDTELLAKIFNIFLKTN